MEIRRIDIFAFNLLNTNAIATQFQISIVINFINILSLKGFYKILKKMANTFTNIYIHAVFTVKGRQNLLHPKFKKELYMFITGIVKNKNQKLICINGMPDHVHLFLGLKPDVSLSSIMRDIKANSSRFINEKKWIAGKFEWQTGFGAFSYSHSQIDKICNYIKNQENHHKIKSFKEEYLELYHFLIVIGQIITIT